VQLSFEIKVTIQVMPQNSENNPNVTVYDRLIYKKEACELYTPYVNRPMTQ
jgi:hypothetical protein